MEIAQESSSSSSIPAKKLWLSSVEKLKEKVVKRFGVLKKIGTDDPRRILHSIKVGLALAIISLFYYVKPLFNSFGAASAMWAVLTVVVVMEFTVGGTLGKGLNRAFATFLAGGLGLGAHYVANLAGNEGKLLLLALFDFLLAAAATFSRFIPEIKARYDYGVTIFILTFSLVAVSSYRVEELVQLAHQRLATVALGVTTCLFTSIFVFPVWAGEDLHNLIAANLDKLTSFLEGLEAEFLDKKLGGENSEDKSFLQVFKGVLNSKHTEEALANFARWEPCHGRFGFRHPWKQYLKIGTLIRQCAYSIDALATYIAIPYKTQPTTDTEFYKKLRSACAEMSSESAKALLDLTQSIRNMTSPLAASLHVSNALAAAGKLRTAMMSADSITDDVIRLATAASLLAQVVESTHQIMGAVHELAKTAKFKKPISESESEFKFETVHQAKVKPGDDVQSPPQVTINIE